MSIKAHMNLNVNLNVNLSMNLNSNLLKKKNQFIQFSNSKLTTAVHTHGFI